MEGQIDLRKINDLTKWSQHLQQKAFIMHREGVAMGKAASSNYASSKPFLKQRVESRMKIKIAKNMVYEAAKLSEAAERLRNSQNFDQIFLRFMINYRRIDNSLIYNVKF